MNTDSVAQRTTENKKRGIQDNLIKEAPQSHPSKAQPAPIPDMKEAPAQIHACASLSTVIRDKNWLFLDGSCLKKS